jgi:hypothetical protein
MLAAKLQFELALLLPGQEHELRRASNFSPFFPKSFLSLAVAMITVGHLECRAVLCESRL